MDTPRPRFSVMPILLALTVGLLQMPATLIVKVNARGIGLARELPWLNRSIDAGRAAFAVLASQTWVRPAVVAGAVLLAALFIDPSLLLAAPFAIGATLTEGQYATEAIVWEANSLFRKSITVLSGQNLKAGAVIGRVNRGVGRMSVPTVVGTGNGTVNTVFGGPETQVGNYVVTCTSAVTHGGVWSVVNPSGKALPALTMTPGAGGSTLYRSREINFTIVDGSTDFAAGDVFTFVVSTTAPTVVGTGNGTVSAITLGPDAKYGNYRLEITAAITNGGEFKLTGPDGDITEQGFIVAGAGGTFVGANKRQINFTLTEGSTDFAVGDAFNILVFNELNGGKVVAWDPTAVDGRQVASGVLYAAVDASAADKKGVVIANQAIVSKGALQWGAAITAAQKESAYLDLAARNITALDAASA